MRGRPNPAGLFSLSAYTLLLQLEPGQNNRAFTLLPKLANRRGKANAQRADNAVKRKSLQAAYLPHREQQERCRTFPRMYPQNPAERHTGGRRRQITFTIIRYQRRRNAATVKDAQEVQAHTLTQQGAAGIIERKRKRKRTEQDSCRRHRSTPARNQAGRNKRQCPNTDQSTGTLPTTTTRAAKLL